MKLFLCGLDGIHSMLSMKIQTQTVCYMDHIQHPPPPTRLDVVKETLKRSQSVSKACGEEFTLITYDLAVAKIAKQLQCTEPPTFDDIFIMFGSFHIELSIFSSLGRLIEGSGGPFVLSESSVIAAGSLNKFLKGKMYNRCKRGNILLATALHALHFRKFCQEKEIDVELLSCLKIWACSDTQTFPPNLDVLAIQYQTYCNDTALGCPGKTAQFWINYCYLVAVQRKQTMSLFAFSLYELSSLFFSTNYPNYTRWMPLYALELKHV